MAKPWHPAWESEERRWSRLSERDSATALSRLAGSEAAVAEKALDEPAGPTWSPVAAGRVGQAAPATLSVATDSDIDACIDALDRARSPGAPPLKRTDIRRLAIPWLLANGMTTKLAAVEARWQSPKHRHRRGKGGRRGKLASNSRKTREQLAKKMRKLAVGDCRDAWLTNTLPSG